MRGGEGRGSRGEEGDQVVGGLGFGGGNRKGGKGRRGGWERLNLENFSCLSRAEQKTLSRTGLFVTQERVCVCEGVTVWCRGGGRALLVIKRWNINATLPLISFHLSSSCPLRVRLS